MPVSAIGGKADLEGGDWASLLMTPERTSPALVLFLTPWPTDTQLLSR